MVHPIDICERKIYTFLFSFRTRTLSRDYSFPKELDHFNESRDEINWERKESQNVFYRDYVTAKASFGWKKVASEIWPELKILIQTICYFPETFWLSLNGEYKN